MWIAACCLAYEAPLATLNLKDYAEYHGLPILGAQ
jgi:predicted nucleic acid-binding protein